MDTLKTIFVGHDFSAGADAALEQAARLAKWNDSTISILHVVDEVAVTDLATALKQSRQSVTANAVSRAKTDLAKRVTRLGITATIEVVVGSRLDVLLTWVDEARPNLVLAGAWEKVSGNTGAGMLATRLIRKAATKVMLVQPGHGGRYKNVMACVDFSETSAEVIRQAGRIAARDGSKLHALHVYEPPWDQLQGDLPSPVFSDEFKQRFAAMLTVRLKEFVAESGGDPAHCSVRADEHHSYGITQFARETDVDLLILGTHGRTRLKYLLLGSTAEALLRHLECSVLSIRAKDAPNILHPATTTRPAESIGV